MPACITIAFSAPIRAALRRDKASTHSARVEPPERSEHDPEKTCFRESGGRHRSSEKIVLQKGARAG
jgi:hypothetical protein